MSGAWGNSWGDSWGSSWGQGVTPTPPVANFSASPLTGVVPLTVAFTDLSLNSPTSWLWDFGDGSTSTLENPSHVYAASGTYTVSLTATNAVGSDKKTSAALITATAAPAPPPAPSGQIGGGIGTSANIFHGLTPTRPRYIADDDLLTVKPMKKRDNSIGIAVALLLLGDD